MIYKIYTMLLNYFFSKLILQGSVSLAPKKATGRPGVGVNLTCHVVFPKLNFLEREREREKEREKRERVEPWLFLNFIIFISLHSFH